MRPGACLLFAALAATIPPASARPEARSLHWRLLEVEARLDSIGDLHVIERQAMVFTGDWNGGERAFRLDPGQRVRLARLVRMEGGRERALEPGRLDLVDGYAFVGPGERTLRWRSRAPSDPPFQGTEITYVLMYTLSGVLVRDGSGYRLTHDFAFPDRPGIIREVRAQLTLDPSWSAPGSALTLSRRDLPPGQGAVLTVPLRWAGQGSGPAPLVVTRGQVARPAAAVAPARLDLGTRSPRALDEPLARLLHGALLAALLGAAVVVWLHDWRRGRYGLPLAERIDGEWLQRHVLRHPAEVIGAAFSGRVGAREVSAVLARLIAAGKLRHWIEPARKLWAGRTLHLQLTVPRSSLRGCERILADTLFVAGDTIVAVRRGSRFRYTGVDPAPRMRARLQADVAALAPPPSPSSHWPLRAAAVLLAGAALAAWLAIWSGADVGELTLPLLPAFILSVVVVAMAPKRASSPLPELPAAAGLLLALGLWAGVVSWAGHGTSAATVPCHVLCWAAGLTWAAGVARTRQAPEAHALRFRMLAARRYLASALRRRSPELRDEWVPHLIALGLTDGLMGWAAPRPGCDTGDPSAPGAGSPAWTGGGGTFAGAGASGSWGDLASFASGPSSGSGWSSGSGEGSDSGGGSDSSSGGGGGGGW